MNPRCDLYQQALHDLDQLLERLDGEHQIAWVTTARHLDRVIRAGERMKQTLTALTPSKHRDAVEQAVNGWHHAINNGGDP